jgi:hypothetical protein
MADAPNFRGLRKEIATVLADARGRTLYEIAKALGRQSGGIQRVVRQLHADGILVSSDDEPVRGTEFFLNPAYLEPLEQALRSDQPPGLVVREQELLWIKPESRAALRPVMQRADLSAPISWIARLGRAGEMVIAISPQATEGDVERLVAALGVQGIDFAAGKVSSVLGAEEMRSLERAGDELDLSASGV